MPELDQTFPALDTELFDVPDQERLTVREPSRHRPRFLMLYGSLRGRSYSRLLTFEAARQTQAKIPADVVTGFVLRSAAVSG